MANEEPTFEVIDRRETFEVRRYQPFVIAEVKIEDKFKDAGNRAFNTLFQYISGANRGAAKMEMTVPVIQAPVAGQKMKMTAPLLQRSGTEAGSYLVSFVLPLRYDSATAPEPTDPKVQIREVPARVMAVSRYSGFWSESRYLKHETELLAAIKSAGYQPVGLPEWARYNSPFTPWFLRRNEVMVEVRKADGA